MAYVAGTATSWADLMSAIASALTSNGFAQNTNVFSKGGLYVDIQNMGTHLRIQGGTGIDGGDELTGTPFDYGSGREGFASMGVIGTSMAFNCSYFIHILTAPDEVYIFVNDSTDRYSWIAFGQSPVAGLPGSGNWYGATLAADQDSISGGPFSLDAVTRYAEGRGLFVSAASPGSGTVTAGPNCFFHHGMDSGINTTGWSAGGNRQDVGTEVIGTTWPNTVGMASAYYHIYEMFYDQQPNTFNNESVLFRIRPTVGRDDEKVSTVGQLEHARYVRIDNYTPEEMITLGVDEWKLYPFLKKNMSQPLGSNSAIDHSGAAGLAVRYDGP